jgi:homoserine kinase
MALTLYNHTFIKPGAPSGKKLEVIQKTPSPEKSSVGWFFEPVTNVPADETHLIYKSFAYLFFTINEPVPPVTIIQEDYIPADRGLGSSAACVVAGLLAANMMTGNQLSHERLIDIAARIEGHPDNTTPALAGGLTVGVMTDRGLVYSKVPDSPWAEKLRFALFIPAFGLSTAKARAVLPPQYARRDLIYNASRSALLIAALTSGDFEKLAEALNDRVHQPYRQDLVPGMAEIMREAPSYGAYNVVLSGAGPALLAMTEDEKFVDKIKPFAAQLLNSWDVGWIKPDLSGAAAEEIEDERI